MKITPAIPPERVLSIVATLTRDLTRDAAQRDPQIEVKHFAPQLFGRLLAEARAVLLPGLIVRDMADVAREPLLLSTHYHHKRNDPTCMNCGKNSYAHWMLPNGDVRCMVDGTPHDASENGMA